MPVGPKRLLPYIAGFYALLFLFTTFTLLYEFVIPHGGIVITNPVTTTADPTGTDTTDATTAVDLVYPGEVPAALLAGTVLGTFESENVLLTLYQIRASNSDVYVADVVTTDGYQILTALAFDTFGGTNIVQTVSTMADNHDAIFAINSDYASHYDSGYVIRNGMILRTTASYRDCVVLNADGSVDFHTEEETTLQSIVDDGAWQLWSFGPVIVDDGVSVASVNDGLSRDAVNNPRSGFGVVAPNHFMFVTVDGRTDVSHGADIEEFAGIMLLLGCTQAYNFDGGGSATMWFDGAVVNHPSEGTERKVGDCVYIRR